MFFRESSKGLHGSWEDLRLVSVSSVSSVRGRMENGAIEGLGVHVLGLKPWGFQVEFHHKNGR